MEESPPVQHSTQVSFSSSVFWPSVMTYTTTEVTTQSEIGSSKPLNHTVGAMKDSPATDSSKSLSVYAYNLWNRGLSFSLFSDSTFLGKISNLYRQTARRRKRRACLPLPLPSNDLGPSLVESEASGVYDVLEDIMERLFLSLHSIQKNLQFWQSRAEGSNARKMYHMMFERGPRAFVGQSVQLLGQCLSDGSALQNLCHSASAHILERTAILTRLRSLIATFLSQVYIEVDKCGEKLVKDPQKTLCVLLITINRLFSELETSIGHLHASFQDISSLKESFLVPLLFEELPEISKEGSEWTESETKDAISLVYRNLDKLDTFVSLVVAKHRKPKKVTLYWIRYTCGAVGLSVCSMWLLRHSRMMGSPDIDNWIREAKDSTVSFFSDHVEQPLLSIRDELFETFRKRHRSMMELEEVHLTSDSLRRMLQAFTEQTKGQSFSKNASEQEMLEIVMSRYEKEISHPIQNLVNGELARALLIQVQKLKLDIETAMVELNQILRANEINFAILAALPAFFLSVFLLALVRAWYKQDTRAEGRGRVARLQRRLLVVEIEKRIMQYQTYLDQGLEREAQSTFGLVLYSLDRLYHAVERHAKATGEWQCLRDDLSDLGRPGLATAYKLTVTSRLERVYDCLLPALTRQ